MTDNFEQVVWVVKDDDNDIYGPYHSKEQAEMKQLKLKRNRAIRGRIERWTKAQFVQYNAMIAKALEHQA